MSEGESIFVQGSAKKPYEIKMVGGAFSCNCMAWRNQSLPPDVRTCKHIIANVANATSSTGATQSPLGTLAVPATALGGRKPAVVKSTAPECLLAHTWDGEQDLSGWLVSEKLDGVRAWWNGSQFITRLGNVYNAPAWFTKGLPTDTVLDGELWAGRKKFQKCIAAVRKLNPVDSEWKEITFMVYDSPNHGGPFEERLAEVERLTKGLQYAKLHLHVACSSVKALQKELVRVEKLGAEGLMAREPGALYDTGRSTTLLKIKSFKDEEGTVIEHLPGKGKHKGRLGAVVVRLKSGKEVAIGTGFKDKDRVNPPKIGSEVTFRYFELTDGNIPRFPVFISARDYE